MAIDIKANNLSEEDLDSVAGGYMVTDEQRSEVMAKFADDKCEFCGTPFADMIPNYTEVDIWRANACQLWCSVCGRYVIRGLKSGR